MDIEKISNMIYKNIPITMAGGDSLRLVKTSGGVESVIFDVTLGAGKAIDGNIGIRADVRLVP